MNEKIEINGWKLLAIIVMWVFVGCIFGANHFQWFVNSQPQSATKEEGGKVNYSQGIYFYDVSIKNCHLEKGATSTEISSADGIYNCVITVPPKEILGEIGTATSTP